MMAHGIIIPIQQQQCLTPDCIHDIIVKKQGSKHELMWVCCEGGLFYVVALKKPRPVACWPFIRQDNMAAVNFRDLAGVSVLVLQACKRADSVFLCSDTFSSSTAHR